MAAPASLHADGANGRIHATADRGGSKPDFHRSRVTRGRLKLHRNFHHVDGHYRVAQLAKLPRPIVRPATSLQRHKTGGCPAKNSSTLARTSRLRNTTRPVASAPCAWKTRFAMSSPIVLACSTDASFRWSVDTATLAPKP